MGSLLQPRSSLLIAICRKFSGKSYWHQPGSEPLTALTLGHLVDKAAERWPDREAVVSCHQGHRLTFSQVKKKVDRLAAGLRDVGLYRGDRVALWGGNSSEWYLTALAAGRAGIYLVCVNPAYEVTELRHCLNKVGARGLVAAETTHSKVLTLAPELDSSAPGALRSEAVPELTTVVFMSEDRKPGSFQFNDVVEGATKASLETISNLQHDIQPDEGCNIQFTSGTTGKPKAAILTHHNIVNNSYLVGKRLQFDRKYHRVCLQVPMFHCYGFCNGILAAMHHGATLVLPTIGFKAQASIEAIEKEKCSFVYGTPTMYVDLLAQVGDRRLDSLEAALSSGSLGSEQLLSDLKKRFSLDRICSVYGLTETSPVMFQSLPTDNEEHMLTTVGHVSEHVEVKVVDREGRMVPLGSPGELCVRGYLTMAGYWQDEQKTKELIDERHWLKTGDMFVLREDGYGQIVGRIKDIIIRGGENIYPKEIEELLEAHPEILEAQVFGVPHERLGEQVCACIRLKAGSTLTIDDVKDYSKGKISGFKIPRIIEIVDMFPRTSSGKIEKYKLREAVMKKHNIQ